MSRLDRHVASVRNKLAVHHFGEALAWLVLVVAGGLTLLILVQRLLGLNFHLSHLALDIGIGSTVGVAATAWAIWRRPSPTDAAIAIDQQLKLKEKFSTALYVRASSDAFVQAAVRDAENTADSVRLDRQFPLRFPRAGGGAILLAGVALVCYLYVPVCDPLGRQEAAAKKAAQHVAITQVARQNVETALAKVQSLPPAAAQSADFKVLEADLKKILEQPSISDIGKANRKAAEALEDVHKAIANEENKVRRFADEQNALFHESLAPSDDKGPVADARNDIHQGKFADAEQTLQKLGENYDKMDAAEKTKAAQQMAKLAADLQKMAEDPKVDKQIEKQLQQAGMNQQQAQQMAQQMKDAANGDKQAQQQVAQKMQQMQQQVRQQIQQAQQQAQQGNQQAAAQTQQLQQQLQQMQQAAAAAQAAANAQSQANAMSQAAQQMGQAMQQQAGAQAGQKGQGGQQGQQGQQGMQQGQAAMQQALQQLQAAQQDAQQIANAQQQAQQAAQQAMQGQACQQPGQGLPGQGHGQWAAGQPPQAGPGGGQGGPGIGNGGNGQKEASPFAVKAEQDSSDENDTGKILASTFIKTKSDPGHSTAQLQKVAEAVKQEEAQEVEADHVTGQGRKAAEKYFSTMDNDVKPQP